MSPPVSCDIPAAAERPRVDVDIACVGFGPATGGFLTTLSRGLLNADGSPKFESAVAPGLPPQIVCYERADDVGFGVSGAVTLGRGIRESFPGFDARQIPMATPVTSEKMVYLLDPWGASRRPWLMRLADRCLRAFSSVLPMDAEGLELPWIPAFLHKKDGFVCSLGQFNQRVANQLMSTGLVQIWPGTPVTQAIFENGRVAGVQLMDQGTDKVGHPADGFLPGAEVRAALTVVGDGPVGAIGQQLDRAYGLPPGHAVRDWAIGMKFVLELPDDTALAPGTVLHTLGYPEPEIFGFCYVHPDRMASVGIFVPSWFDSPVRTAYRYLQHWMLHPYLWRHFKGARLRSWGAKSLQESGRRGEPRLVGDGYARIGEGSGSTNVLTGSGVDEAWVTGVQLAESVLELLEHKKPFTRDNLEATYVRRRRASWIEAEGRVAEKSRDGFQRGVIAGLVGMALTGMTGGRLNVRAKPGSPHKRFKSIESFYKGRISGPRVRQILDHCRKQGRSTHADLMEAAGWPEIPFDGRLLLTQQDALLLGGKVQAPSGCADHVVFLYPSLCVTCGHRLCIEMCSGQAITAGENGVPLFDREKCIHCGACLWNCPQPIRRGSTETNIAFRAGTGGLHSAEN